MITINLKCNRCESIITKPYGYEKITREVFGVNGYTYHPLCKICSRDIKLSKLTTPIAEVGDKLICIEPTHPKSNKSLTYGKSYIVTRVQRGTHQGSNIPLKGVWVINDDGVEKYYSSIRFIRLEDWRDNLIDNILE